MKIKGSLVWFLCIMLLVAIQAAHIPAPSPSKIESATMPGETTTAAGAPIDEISRSGNNLLFAGTYTKRGNGGIHVYRINPHTAVLTPQGPPTRFDNPTFLAIGTRTLYVAGEGGATGGQAAAFRIADDGSLTLLNTHPAKTAGPCHVSLSPNGLIVGTANYGEGSVTIFPVQEDGRLGDGHTDQFTGRGTHPQRQTAPHFHSLTFEPHGDFAIAADLGTDHLILYRPDTDRGNFVRQEAPLTTPPGSGPRHVAFHPNGQWVYVITELANTILTYQIKPDRSGLEFRSTTSTLPADFRGQSTAADIHVHPGGRYLYASNRGLDSIATFSIRPDGTPQLINQEPTRGKHPRNFMITPTGDFLLVANMQSNAVEGFRIDPTTGALAWLGRLAEIESPTCLVMPGSR